MRRKILIAAVLSVVLVLSAAGVAMALDGLTLTASPTTVTYPHRALLTLESTPTATTATVYAMPVGASDWTTVSTTVTSTLSVKPRVTTVYKAVAEGVESLPVTVTVKARLTHPVLPSVFRHGREVRVRGTMSPSETSATVTVTYFKLQTTYKYLGKGRYRKLTTWDQFGDPVVLNLHRVSRSVSTWKTRFKSAEPGRFKVVVVHEDLAHAKSSATSYFRVW